MREKYAPWASEAPGTFFANDGSSFCVGTRKGQSEDELSPEVSCRLPLQLLLIQ